MCENIPRDEEKCYWSVAGAISFGPFFFIEWDDDPISLMRWNTTRQPDPVKEQMQAVSDVMGSIALLKRSGAIPSRPLAQPFLRREMALRTSVTDKGCVTTLTSVVACYATAMSSRHTVARRNFRTDSLCSCHRLRISSDDEPAELLLFLTGAGSDAVPLPLSFLMARNAGRRLFW